jgi:isoleucyl-tRNA synthetase
MSAVYLDILKDRLYTFRKDDPRRRSSQTVLFEVVIALTKLMAPILSFTADEIWRMLSESVCKSPETPSVHLALFPKPDPKWADARLSQRWERLLAIREQVLDELEGLRQQKQIGSSLEAIVTVNANPKTFGLLKAYQADLATLFIVSEVVLSMEPNLSQDVKLGFQKAQDTYKKCERCWNYRQAVGVNPEHPTLCDRCVEAIGGGAIQ